MTNILHIDEVIARSGKSRTSLWRAVRAGRFPPPLKVGANRIGWLENEIAEWQESLPRIWQPAAQAEKTNDAG